MRNFKKILSLVLCMAMMLSVMVVGAGAAFKDQEKIVNTEAVDACVALNIINGYTDGSYRPEGNITRAEACKMICVALNGGKEPVLGTNATPTFTDIKGHWAEKYIEYCYSEGIVAGVGGGKFNPAGNVTGSQFAKMLLTAMGFSANHEKFVGEAWEVNVNVKASQKDLYEDLASMDPSVALTRDNAAQMVWNALDAVMVKYDYKLTTVNGELQTVAIVQDDGTKTILNQKYKMETGYGYMNKITYNETEKEYTYHFSDGAAGHGWPELEDITVTSGVVLDTTMKSAEDFSDLYGMKVKVLYKLDNDKTVYGMYAVDSKVLFEGVGDDYDAAKGEFDGKEIDLNTGATSYAYNVNTTATAINAIAKETAFVLIDNNGDGDGDIAVTYPVTVAKVTFAGKDSVTVGYKSYKVEDTDVYEGIAKDDYAIITAKENTKNDTPVIAKADIVSGTVEAVKGTDVKVGGTWYSDATTKAANSDPYALNKTFDLVVVNGFVYYAEQVDAKANVEDVVYVIKADAPGTSSGTIDFETQKVELMFTDGTKKVVTVDKIDAKTLGTMDVPANDNKAAADELYTYAVDKDGNYELSQMVSGDYDSTLASTSSYAIVMDEGKATVNNANTHRFSDTAVVFAKGNDGKVKVLSGATINTWENISTTTAAGSILYADKANGFNTVVVGKLMFGSTVPGAAGDTTYGWITGKPALVKIDDDYFFEVTIWNGTEEFTAIVEDTATTTSITSSSDVTIDANVAQGTPVSYKALADNHVETVTALTIDADAVTGYANGKDIEFADAGAAKIDNDTVILYVDTANNEGIKGGAISIADKDALDNYIKNVYVAVDADNTVDYIIVDTSNNLDANSSACSITALSDGTNSALINQTDRTITLNGATITITDNAVDASCTITVSANAGYSVNAATTTLAADDTIIVVAEDGTVVTYTVIA